MLVRWRVRRDAHSWDRLLLDAIDECAYRFDSGERGEGNVEKFLAQARDATPDMTIDAFVEELERVRKENPREPDAPPEDSSDTVKVMTVHSAKGLEFPVVFVAAMHKGTRSDLAAVEFSRRHGLGATWKNPAGGRGKVDLVQLAIREERKKREREESSRLLYVAMTRAEDHLVLSCSFGDRKPENWAATISQSLFIDLAGPREETIECQAPDGRHWNLHVLSTATPPPLTTYEGPAEEEVERVFVDLPDVHDQHDTNATVTAVTTFQQCPRRYYLGRYLGQEGRLRRFEPGDEERDLSASELGTEVHAILAGTPLPDPDPLSSVLARVFTESALGRRAARAQRIGRECDFMMAVGDLVLRGQVDLWFEDAGELVLVDYKTDDVTAHQAHDRALDYALQIRLYAMAVEELAGRAPDRAYLHFLRPDTAVEVDLTPTLLDSPEQVVAELVEAQDRLEFPMRTAAHCKRCPFYRDLCPAGAE
jgi:ATP-dependent exoDNAse (exonuclease V) beta subunit